MTAALEFTVPVSVRDLEESLAGWPYRRTDAPKMITWTPTVVINGKAEPWNPERNYGYDKT